MFVARRRSTPGRHYVFVCPSGDLTCSCEAFEHDQPCHAMKAVAARLLRNKRELRAAVGLV